MTGTARHMEGTAPPATRTSHFEHLDFLRSWAVLLVFFPHLINTLFGTKNTGLGTAAHFGVLIFFVHTSLVLFMSLERLSRNSSWIRQFYIRRIFRIYPLSIVAVIVVVVCRFPPASWMPEINPTGADIAANLLLIQNLVHKQDLLATLWSLPFEIQMYAILPLLFVLRRRFSAWTIWIASFVLAEAVLAASRPAGEIMRYFPCFCGGLVTFSLLRGKPGRHLRFHQYVSLVAVSLLATVSLGHLRTFPAAIDALAALCVGILTGLMTGAVPPILAKASAYIARYSYGIYLSHLPLMMWLLYKPLAAGRVILFALLAVAVPVIAYHVLEEPLIRAGARLAAATGSREGR